MKLNRLLGITMELLRKKRVTATELAARFEVSVRTIYRDVELINQAGIPVASFPGADGGFELMEGYALTKQHFSVTDLSVIYNLLKGLEGAMGSHATALMRKLSSLQPALDGGDDAQVLFEISVRESEKDAVYPLYEALREHRVVAFTYTDASGKISERRAQPLNLYWGRGVWYLEAYCLSRKAKRWFRISRIADLEVTEEMFEPREVQGDPAGQEAAGIPVHLRFDLSAQTRVREQFPDEWVRCGDGIEVRTTFYVMEYAVSVVLSYGAKVEIVSPPELKEALVAEIHKMLKRYNLNQGG